MSDELDLYFSAVNGTVSTSIYVYQYDEAQADVALKLTANGKLLQVSNFYGWDYTTVTSDANSGYEFSHWEYSIIDEDTYYRTLEDGDHVSIAPRMYDMYYLRAVYTLPPQYAEQNVKTSSGYVVVRPKLSQKALQDGDGNVIVDTYAPKSTTLAGYGITDAYTKTEVDSKVGGVFKVKGSCTNAQLTALTDQQTGDVWNITDDGTFPKGSNVVWTGSEWDKLSETVDLSAYALKTDIPTDYVSTSKTDKQTIKSEIQIDNKMTANYMVTNHAQIKFGSSASSSAQYVAVMTGGLTDWVSARAVGDLATDLGVPTSDQQTAWDAKSTVTIRDWSD